MALAEFLAELDQLAAAAQADFDTAADADGLESARVKFLGAKAGVLKAVQKGLGSLAGDEKPAGGKRFNEIKGARLKPPLKLPKNVWPAAAARLPPRRAQTSIARSPAVRCASVICIH